MAQTDKASAAYEKTFAEDARLQPNRHVQENLRDAPQWQLFESTYGDWWVEFSEQTGLPLLAAGTPIELSGNSPKEAVQHFISNGLAQYPVPAVELRWLKTYRQGAYTYVTFEQVHQGRKVLWSQATFQLNDDNGLVFFKLDIYPDITLVESDGLSESALGNIAIDDLYDFSVISIQTASASFILPVLGEQGTYDYSMVKEVDVMAKGPGGMPAKFYTLVDVHTGKVQYRVDQYPACVPAEGVEVRVEDSVIASPVEGGAVEGLPHLRVEVNGATHYTDGDGNLKIPNLDKPVEATFYLDGWYARVIDAGPDSTVYVKDTIYPGNNTVTFDKARLTEVNGYYHSTIMHDHMRPWTPVDFQALDKPMDVKVDITAGYCNAYYSGDAINFFRAGGGCPPSALFHDVIYHEYGHAVNKQYYSYLGGNFSNGALDEGYADIWAFTVTENPVIGKGFLGPASSFIRRYDKDRKVYPYDLTGYRHADGEIIAGAFWDLYLNLGDMGKMMELFSGTFNATPDAPYGKEGQLFREVLLQVLLTDDYDGNLMNGTPNDSAIINAFGKHGISLLADVDITHDPLLLTANTSGNQLKVSVDAPFNNYLGEMIMHFKLKGIKRWKEKTMDKGVDGSYEITLPELQRGDIFQYYFTIEDIYEVEGNTDPSRAHLSGDANLPYFLLVGYEERQVEDFDNYFGHWIINPDGDDDATSGIWEIGEPVPSYSVGKIVQTGTDKTTRGNDNNMCAFTGNAAEGEKPDANEVNLGKTTLQTPPFDLTGYTDPVITYWRWFVNDPPLVFPNPNGGKDPFQVFLSDDGENWHQVERTYIQDISWRQNIIRVNEYVEPTASVYLRFVAQDSLLPEYVYEGDNIVEAAIDDVKVLDVIEQVPTGADQPAVSNLEIYPSPASKVIYVSHRSARITSVQLLDINGSELQDISGTADEVAIPVAELSNGLYLLKVKTDSGTTTQRVLVQH